MALIPLKHLAEQADKTRAERAARGFNYRSTRDQYGLAGANRVNSAARVRKRAGQQGDTKSLAPKLTQLPTLKYQQTTTLPVQQPANLVLQPTWVPVVENTTQAAKQSTFTFQQPILVAQEEDAAVPQTQKQEPAARKRRSELQEQHQVTKKQNRATEHSTQPTPSPPPVTSTAPLPPAQQLVYLSQQPTPTMQQNTPTVEQFTPPLHWPLVNMKKEKKISPEARTVERPFCSWANIPGGPLTESERLALESSIKKQAIVSKLDHFEMMAYLQDTDRYGTEKDCFACFTCWLNKRREEFGTVQPSDGGMGPEQTWIHHAEAGRVPEQRDSTRRFCMACGVRYGKYPCGTIIRSMTGREHWVCACSILHEVIPSSPEYHCSRCKHPRPLSQETGSRRPRVRRRAPGQTKAPVKKKASGKKKAIGGGTE